MSDKEKIRELEDQLSHALNPYSSRGGSVVYMEDGIISYRIDGKFIPISKIKEALLCQEWYVLEQARDWFVLCRAPIDDCCFVVNTWTHTDDPTCDENEFETLSGAVHFAVRRKIDGHTPIVYCGETSFPL